MSSGCQSFYVRLIEHTAIPEMNFYRFDDTNNIIRRITAKMLIAAGTDARDRTTTATYCPQNDTWDNMQRLRSDKNDGVSTNKTKTRIVAVVHHFKSNCSRSKQVRLIMMTFHGHNKNQVMNEIPYFRFGSKRNYLQHN